MSEVKMPRSFKVSSKATEAARAARDPNLKAPPTAKVDIDKNGVSWKRWTETGSIEFAYREASKDGVQVVYVVGIKMRPGEANQNKIGWFRLRVHPDVVEGKADQAVQDKYGWLTDRALVGLVSLVDVTGFTPKNAESGLTDTLLEALFPLQAQKTKGHLVGKSVTVKIVQRPNAPPYDKEKPFQEDAELFLPPVPVPGLPAELQ